MGLLIEWHGKYLYCNNKGCIYHKEDNYCRFENVKGKESGWCIGLNIPKNKL